MSDLFGEAEVKRYYRIIEIYVIFKTISLVVSNFYSFAAELCRLKQSMSATIMIELAEI